MALSHKAAIIIRAWSRNLRRGYAWNRIRGLNFKTFLIKKNAPCNLLLQNSVTLVYLHYTTLTPEIAADLYSNRETITLFSAGGNLHGYYFGSVY